MQRVNRTARTTCARLWVLSLCIVSSWFLADLTYAHPKTIKSGPYIQALGANGVEVRAELDSPAPLELTVGGPGTGETPLTSAAATMHVVSVRGLQPRTRYTYGVSVSGAKVEGAFVTAPAETATEPFTALLYGDNRTDDEAHALVVREMVRTPSDLLLHTGDFVGDSRRSEEWVRFFSIEQPLLRDRCVFAAIGNHDLIDDGDAYKRYFGALNWTMRSQFLRFWFVNAMGESPTGWLLRDLAAHDGEAGVLWRVIVLHQGPYASGPHGANDVITSKVVDEWRAHKVDLALSGHDHIYERGYARGLGYVVSGGGGAPPYRIDSVLATSRKAEASRHFVELRFAPDDIRLLAHRADGTPIEERTFLRGRGWDEETAGPKNLAGDGPKPSSEERNEKKGGPGNVIAAVAGAGVLGLLILALRRRYGSGKS